MPVAFNKVEAVNNLYRLKNSNCQNSVYKVAYNSWRKKMEFNPNENRSAVFLFHFETAS